jgi:hypothetical protein
LSFRDAADFDRTLPELLGAGARLVSVSPVKETLEDRFLREVGGGEGAREVVGEG